MAKTQLGNKQKLRDKKHILEESIKAYNEKMEGDVSLPINFKYRIKKINLENCKVQIEGGKHIKLIMLAIAKPQVLSIVELDLQ